MIMRLEYLQHNYFKNIRKQKQVRKHLNDLETNDLKTIGKHMTLKQKKTTQQNNNKNS